MVSVGLSSEEVSDCVSVDRPNGRSDVLLICEHASRLLPPSLGDLGLPAEALASHIAWDPGALATAAAMSTGLDATLVHQRFSRLIYDCNRPPESPGAMPERSEIYDVPGNHALSEAERKARTAGLYVPFHAAVSDIIRRRKEEGRRTVIVTMHSFTPVYLGKTRAVELGILHDGDSRFADRMLAAAGEAPLYRTERNQPYGPEDGVTHTLKLHGISNGLENVMIEIRNDLIAEEIGQRVMADYLMGLIGESLSA